MRGARQGPLGSRVDSCKSLDVGVKSADRGFPLKLGFGRRSGLRSFQNPLSVRHSREL